jgi:ferritin-like metal-binding protein YciE
MKTLKDLFLNELADMYDAEHQIQRALPKLVEAATCEKLKKVLLSHQKESDGQIKHLDEVFESAGAKPHGKACDATVGILKETHDLAAHFKGSPVLNAALVNAAQKIEHYEIAAYGGLHEWAVLLGNKKGAELLKSILAEEKAANDALTALARSTCNPEALSVGAALHSTGTEKPTAPQPRPSMEHSPKAAPKAPLASAH